MYENNIPRSSVTFILLLVFLSIVYGLAFAYPEYFSWNPDPDNVLIFLQKATSQLTEITNHIENANAALEDVNRATLELSQTANTSNLAIEQAQQILELQVREGNLNIELVSISLEEALLNLGMVNYHMEGIQSEISKSKEIVLQLEQKANIYERVISSDQGEVEAIAFILMEYQSIENKRGLWINTAIGLLTNVIVALISIYFEYKVGFFRRWLTPKNGDI
jgi:hypothetical protein